MAGSAGVHAVGGFRLAGRLACLVGLTLLLFAAGARAAVITVNTSADDLTPGDGSVSLREAIQAIDTGNTLGDPDIAAQNPGTFGSGDTINFDIPGSTRHTIAVGSLGNGSLPALTKTMTINGYSQSGASVNTLVGGTTPR